MDYSTECQIIDKIIEPFTVVDGRIYYSTSWGTQKECKSLYVAVHPGRVRIGNSDLVPHEVTFSSLGYESPSKYELHSFCFSVQERMLYKFGWGFDYSNVEKTDDYSDIHQFWVRPKHVEQRLKPW